MTNMRYKLFFPLLLVALVGSLLFHFWQPSDIAKGSFTYYLKIPSSVRAYPIWQAANSPVYRVRFADGEKPGFIGLNYESTLLPTDFTQTVNQLNFHCNALSPSEGVCNKTNADGTFLQITYTYNSSSDNLALELGFFNY